MNKKLKNLRPFKVYSEHFRLARVKEYESGKLTVNQIHLTYGVAKQSVYLWIYRYSAYNKKGYKIVEHSKSLGGKVSALQEKVAELERLLGQKQIIIDYQQALIKKAEDVYQIEIEKNSNTPQSK